MQSSDKSSQKAEKQRLKLQKEELDVKLKRIKVEELESKQKKALQKQSLDSSNVTGPYGTEGEPRKALSTFLRNQNKFQINGISIIDRKAAILLNLATGLVSGAIVFHDYIDQNVPNGHLVSIIFIIGLTISMVLAIIGTKPGNMMIRKVIQSEVVPKYPFLEFNNFFGPGQASLTEYEESMEKVISSQNLQLGNQIRANYIIAKYNNTRSKIIDYGYNIFLSTFLIVAITVLVARFF